MALISGNPNLRLKIYNEEFSTIRGFIKATTSSLYGISAFVILFGLLNMVNMLISIAIVRKREFALLQAVGMTNQQLRKMLYREGMSISVKSAILATFFGVTVGALLCYLANKVLALKFILFEFNIFPVLLFSILLVGLQICISYGVSRSIEKDTLVERLRTE
jgi:putative ABC transport system permease protein